MSYGIDIDVSPQQWEFINATEDEVMYGGAAGGGKSYGQILDGFLKAMQYPGMKQIMFRKTFRELEKSLIRVSQEVYPQSIATYNESKHMWKFKNGSIIDFGYLATESDVYNYQSAEYDIIRLDEATHFTKFQYEYMRSRIRGANSFPKQLKCSTNPGNVGHAFIRERFIDPGRPNETMELVDDDGDIVTLRFIPAKVQDNMFLAESDPQYVKRLKILPEKERRMLLFGDWDVFEGQFFTEFKRETHVVTPFAIPDHWQRYRAFDYGLDMLACYWAAFDELGNCYIYNEYYEKNLLIQQAAEAILSRTPNEEQIRNTFAPFDMWSTNRATGKFQAEIFADNGLTLTQVRNSREAGWQNMLAWLHPVPDGTGEVQPRLKIFSNCTKLISVIPLQQHDEKNPNDVAKEPHEISHYVDAVRYLLDGRPQPTEIPTVRDEDDPIEYEDQVDNFIDYGGY